VQTVLDVVTDATATVKPASFSIDTFSNSRLIIADITR